MISFLSSIYQSSIPEFVCHFWTQFCPREQYYISYNRQSVCCMLSSFRNECRSISESPTHPTDKEGPRLANSEQQTEIRSRKRKCLFRKEIDKYLDRIQVKLYQELISWPFILSYEIYVDVAFPTEIKILKQIIEIWLLYTIPSSLVLYF